MSSPTLGVLGGLGPMSGIYFCELITRHTYALCDNDHINFILSSRADTPDRSSFILGISSDDPTPTMIAEAKRLKAAGARIIAIPCNTAHHFYSEIDKAVELPVLNIICRTADFCKYLGVSTVAVLATEGTAASGTYPKIFSERGIEVMPLCRTEQDVVSSIIFSEIKQGRIPRCDELLELCDSLIRRGCQRIILGCTELSLIKKSHALPPYIIDSLELLALSAIAACQKTPVGFDDEIMNFYGSALKGD